MPKNRVPDLADWQVRHTETGTVHHVIRATHLHFHEGWAVLKDVNGNALLGVPPTGRLTIRRLEPGEPTEAPVPPLPGPGYPPSVPDLEVPPAAPAEPAAAPALPRRAAGKRGRPATI